MPDDLPTIDIEGVELIYPGTFDAASGRSEISEQDIDDLIAWHEATAEDVEVPVRLGHWADDSAPAEGWVTRLRKVGAKLVADFQRVSLALADQIKAGRYGPRSVGLNRHVEYAGKEWPVVLDHVALLGAVQPAVSGLNKLADLFSASKGSEAVLVTPPDLAPIVTDDGLLLDMASVAHRLTQMSHGKRGAPALRAHLTELFATAAPFAAAASPPADGGETQASEETTMDENDVREALGIGPDDDPIEAIGAMKAKLDELSTAAEAKEQEGGEQLSRAAQANTELSQRVLDLETKLAQAEAKQLVERYADRIVPANQETALAFALKDPDAAASWFAKQPKVLEFGERGDGGNEEMLSRIAPTSDELSVFRAMHGGNDPNHGQMTDLMKQKAKRLGIALPENFSAPGTKAKAEVN